MRGNCIIGFSVMSSVLNDLFIQLIFSAFKHNLLLYTAHESYDFDTHLGYGYPSKGET